MARGVIIPTVFESGNKGWKTQDIYSKLLEDRVVILDDEVNSYTASVVSTSLLYLEGRDSKLPIRLIINSPGGSVMDGLKIVDIMNFVSCPVSTLATGLAASMGCVILAAGEPGMRFALPNTQIMAHQVSSGSHGTTADLEVHMNHVKFLNDQLVAMLADCSGSTKEKIVKETQRDKWLTAKDALNFGKKGLIDKIITKSSELINIGK